MIDAIYRSSKNPVDSPQNIESTTEHWEKMLSLRLYTPNEEDEALTGQLQHAQFHYDWLNNYNLYFILGEAAHNWNVRMRTYNIIKYPPSRFTHRAISGSRLIYYSTPFIGGQRFHHIRMFINPEGVRQNNNPYQPTQLLHFVFSLLLNNESASVPDRIVGLILSNLNDTWCGYGKAISINSTANLFWRIVTQHQAQSELFRIYSSGHESVLDCDIPFQHSFHIQLDSKIILIRIFPYASLVREADTFTVATPTNTWTFGSLIHYFEEVPNARLVLDPFFASPFSKWNLFALSHSLIWRVEHTDAKSTHDFIDRFFALTSRFKGDELQHALQRHLSIADIGDVSHIPLVATNPPFFFRRNMFENLFRAKDVVVLCSETHRTTGIMDSLGLTMLMYPTPDNVFIYYRNGVLNQSNVNVRVSLRYWLRKNNPKLLERRVVTPPPLRFDELLNELLINAIERDNVGTLVDMDGSTVLQSASADTIREIAQKEKVCLSGLIQALMRDSTRTKRIHRMAALYYIRILSPNVLSAYVSGPFWVEVQEIASIYWNTIDVVVQAYPELIDVHFSSLSKEPERLITHNLTFFTLGTPNIDDVTILHLGQVDKSLYEPIRMWSACLDEVNAWLSEPFSGDDERREFLQGLAQLQQIQIQ